MAKKICKNRCFYHNSYHLLSPSVEANSKNSLTHEKPERFLSRNKRLTGGDFLRNILNAIINVINIKYQQ